MVIECLLYFNMQDAFASINSFTHFNILIGCYYYPCFSDSVQFSPSVMSDSATPWTAALQASLSITNSQSLLKLMSIESVMPSNHLILCRSSPSPPAFNPSQHQGLFQGASSLHHVAEVLELQLQHQFFQ